MSIASWSLPLPPSRFPRRLRQWTALRGDVRQGMAAAAQRQPEPVVSAVDSRPDADDGEQFLRRLREAGL